MNTLKSLTLTSLIVFTSFAAQAETGIIETKCDVLRLESGVMVFKRSVQFTKEEIENSRYGRIILDGTEGDQYELTLKNHDGRILIRGEFLKGGKGYVPGLMGTVIKGEYFAQNIELANHDNYEIQCTNKLGPL